jgi:hypothetical protein
MSTEGELCCPLCGKAAALTIDMATDEPGKAVHEECYFNRLIGKDHTALPLPFLPLISGRLNG